MQLPTITLSLQTFRFMFANPTPQNGTSQASQWPNWSIQRFHLPSQTQVGYRKIFSVCFSIKQSDELLTALTTQQKDQNEIRKIQTVFRLDDHKCLNTHETMVEEGSAVLYTSGQY